jgi:hypothetical protein
VLLDRIREEDPEEPFWRGVRAVDQVADGVEVLGRNRSRSGQNAPNRPPWR